MTATKPEHEIVISQFLGEIVREPGNELSLPGGLPGFEHIQTLLPVEIPVHRPLVFLQSTSCPDVCFVCLPVSSIVSNYQIRISEDDRAVLDLDPDRELVMGEDILCLALLAPLPGSVRTNLDAPIIINLRNYRCAQVLLAVTNGTRRLTDDGSWDLIC